MRYYIIYLILLFVRYFPNFLVANKTDVSCLASNPGVSPDHRSPVHSPFCRCRVHFKGLKFIFTKYYFLNLKPL